MSRWHPQTLKDRFMAKVHPEPMSGCWLWGAAADEHGYGRITIDGKTKLSHRVSYSLFCSEINDDDCILHKCDTPACVNPDHLWVGSRKDNYNDMCNKDRNVYGERCVNGKLSEKDALYIRNSKEKGTLLAKRFEVSNALISTIRNGHRWKHLSELCNA